MRQAKNKDTNHDDCHPESFKSIAQSFNEREHIQCEMEFNANFSQVLNKYNPNISACFQCNLSV